jgi:hypothetical protein
VVASGEALLQMRGAAFSIIEGGAIISYSASGPAKVVTSSICLSLNGLTAALIERRDRTI